MSGYKSLVLTRESKDQKLRCGFSRLINPSLDFFVRVISSVNR